MSKLLELFNEAKPLIELQVSFATFRVTSGLWKNRFLITMSMIITLLGMFLMSKHLIAAFDGEINMNILISAIACIAFSQYPLKSFFRMVKRKTFYKFLEETEESYRDQEDDKELNKICEKHLGNSSKIWKLLSIWIIRIFIVCTLLACLNFRFSKQIGLIMDWSFLPEDWIFWNEIPYILEFLIILTAAISGVIADMTTFFIGLEIMASLDILTDYIKLLNEKIKTDPAFFKTILKRHCKVIDNINLLNEAVSEVCFIQMIISTLVLLMMFVLIRKETLEISGYTSCLCVISQIFPLCVFGEMIKIKSEKLSEAFYEVNWYDLSLKDQKIFLIILGMAQRQYGLKAAGMYNVDIYTFIQIVKVAVSYCAILYTLSK
ncbi:Odorant receptor [Sergentomyia squamirostris]